VKEKNDKDPLVADVRRRVAINHLP